MNMKVNFNNLRKQSVYAYEKLVKELNASIVRDDQWAKPNCIHHNQQVNIKGYVLVDAEAIQKHLHSLRTMIGAIAATSMEDEDEFKDVYQEIYPKEGETMPCFNEEEEK